MSLKDQIAADVASVFLNTGELAETVQVNGSGSAVAVVEVGEDPAKGNGVGVGSGGSAAKARIWISAEDLPNPNGSDTIAQASGRVWRVIRIISAVGENCWCLECAADEAVRF
jgi:hypothetical protein